MPAGQVREPPARYGLEDRVQLLSRCIDCNVTTIEVEKPRVLERLEPLTKKYYDRFFMGPSCEKIYWRRSPAFASDPK